MMCKIQNNIRINPSINQNHISCNNIAMSGEIYFLCRQKYSSNDDFYRACRDNLLYEIYLYSNTDGIIQKLRVH